jgi:hypothetical protein
MSASLTPKMVANDVVTEASIAAEKLAKDNTNFT